MQPLFNSHLLRTILRERSALIENEVQSIPANTLQSASEADLAEALAEKLRLDVPVINEAAIHIVQTGETIVIALPFLGDPNLFRVLPPGHASHPPVAEIEPSQLSIHLAPSENLKHQYQQTLNSIQDRLESLSASAADFNRQLPELIATQLKARKRRLIQNNTMTAALGLPLKKREAQPDTYSASLTRKTARISKIIQQTNLPFVPEPALAREDYDQILGILSNMVRVMEQSPQAFLNMEEQDLRTHFLVQLNAVFEGQATGETFNFQGKTDILVRADGKNVFIAECKFWAGEGPLLDALDQLLSYLSWRDTKTAILLFNRMGVHSDVLKRVSQIVPNHPNFTSEEGAFRDLGFRYKFRQVNDPTREIFLTVLVFDLPKQTVKWIPGRRQRRPDPRHGDVTNW
jgi:hypothetical protein